MTVVDLLPAIFVAVIVIYVVRDEGANEFSVNTPVSLLIEISPVYSLGYESEKDCTLRSTVAGNVPVIGDAEVILWIPNVILVGSSQTK